MNAYQVTATQILNVPDAADFCRAHALMGGWASTYLFHADQFFAHEVDFRMEDIPDSLILAGITAGFWRQEEYEGRAVLRATNDSQYLLVHCHDSAA